MVDSLFFFNLSIRTKPLTTLPLKLRFLTISISPARNKAAFIPPAIISKSLNTQTRDISGSPTPNLIKFSLFIQMRTAKFDWLKNSMSLVKFLGSFGTGIICIYSVLLIARWLLPYNLKLRPG